MPRYIRKENGKRRAWVIECRGPSIVTLAGSTGPGRPNFRDYGTKERASQEMARRIAEKLADGWTLEDADATFEDGLGGRTRKARRHSVRESTGLLQEMLRRHGVAANAPFTALLDALHEFEKVRIRAREVGWWYDGDSGMPGDVVDLIIGRQIYRRDEDMTRIDLRLRVELSGELEGDAWYEERISVDELVLAIGESIRSSRIDEVRLEAWD